MRFNTQPPEGGCVFIKTSKLAYNVFQHTATRRWLPTHFRNGCSKGLVSTHSHPKVAAYVAGHCHKT